MMPATSAVLIFTAVLLLLWTLSQRSHEGYMETSYYYEAAPGTRGAKMVCMPEKGSQASLGVAVGAAARYAQRQGGCPVPKRAAVKAVHVKARPACTTSCCVPSCSKPQAVSGGKCKIPASLLAKLKAAVWDPTRPPQTAEQKALIKAVLAEMKKAKKKTPTKGTKTKKKAPAKGKKPSTKKTAPAKGKKPSTKKKATVKGKKPSTGTKKPTKKPTKPKGKAKKPKTLSKKKAGAGPLGSASYAANMNATNVAYGK